MAGSAILTPGVSFTVSQTLSGNPDSPPEICRVALPATFSIVVVSELISVTLAVRTAKKTATPSAMPSSVKRVRSRCRRHCFQVIFAIAEIISVLMHARALSLSLSLYLRRVSLCAWASLPRPSYLPHGGEDLVWLDLDPQAPVSALELREDIPGRISEDDRRALLAVTFNEG